MLVWVLFSWFPDDPGRVRIPRRNARLMVVNSIRHDELVCVNSDRIQRHLSVFLLGSFLCFGLSYCKAVAMKQEDCNATTVVAQICTVFEIPSKGVSVFIEAREPPISQKSNRGTVILCVDNVESHKCRQQSHPHISDLVSP